MQLSSSGSSAGQSALVSSKQNNECSGNPGYAVVIKAGSPITCPGSNVNARCDMAGPSAKCLYSSKFGKHVCCAPEIHIGK